MQRGVVLVRLPVRGVGVQGLLELWVTLVELAGQGLIPIDQGLAELGGRVAHDSGPRGTLSLPLAQLVSRPVFSPPARKGPACCGSYGGGGPGHQHFRRAHADTKKHSLLPSTGQTDTAQQHNTGNGTGDEPFMKLPF